MRTFHIIHPDETIRTALVDKINNLTKPKGSLGRLEELALQVGLIQQTLTPALRKPQNIISLLITALSKKESASHRKRLLGNRLATSCMEEPA